MGSKKSFQNSNVKRKANTVRTVLCMQSRLHDTGLWGKKKKMAQANTLTHSIFYN